MPKNYKADVYSKIFNDARSAVPVKGKKNTYDPENYNKVRAQTLLIGQMEEGEYLESKIEPGAVEYDSRGNLKRIGRNRPAMLDLNFYTRNRYEIEKKRVAIPGSKGKFENETYLLVVMGNAIVRALDDTAELPQTIKVFRFKRESKMVTEYEQPTVQVNEDKPVSLDDLDATEKAEQTEQAETINVEPGAKGVTREVVEWVYMGAERMDSKRVAQMKKSLNVDAMLQLREAIEVSELATETVKGDSLDDLK